MEQTPLTPKTVSSWQQFRGLFPWSFGLIFLIGVFRYFSLTQPILFVISVAGMILGTFLAHLLFAEEQKVLKMLAEALKDPELSTFSHSLLRHGLILILLPVLSLFALTSTRNTVGLGFIWGIMSIYGYDLIAYLRGNEAAASEYFHAFDVEPRIRQAVAAAFLFFTLLFGILLMASRLVV